MIEDKIKEIHQHLNDTDDVSVLSDWNLSLSAEFAIIAMELANVKKERARDEIVLKQQILASEGKYTDKSIERAYFDTDRGRYYLYGTEMLKAISKLISAIRFKIRMLTEPLS